MAQVLYPIFLEKWIRSGLGYVRGLQVMLNVVDNVNQAESLVDMSYFQKHTWHMFTSNFSREIDWEWSLRYV